MDIFLQVLYTALVLGALIFVHELGHFIAAKAFRVQVNEFSLGMGPKLVSVKNKKVTHLFSKEKPEQISDGFTAYSIRLLPIGGYVSMEGEDDESDCPDAFTKKPAWKRFIITIAGVLMNMIVAVLITFILVCVTPVASTTIAEFDEGAVSQQSGLQVGDKIVQIDDTKINSTADISLAFQSAIGQQTVSVTVERDGQQVVLPQVDFPEIYADGTPVSDGDDTTGQLTMKTIDFYVYALPKDASTVLSQTFYQTVSYVKTMYDTLAKLVTGEISVKYISGPVGTSAVIKQAADSGLSSLFMLVGLISINLAVMNLLPLPALDGGRALIYLIEMITRKRLPPSIENKINAVGMIILFALMIFITFKDILFPVL